jgi:hypothetical protein
MVLGDSAIRAQGKLAAGIGIVEQRQGDLLEIVGTGCAAGGFASGLDCREQQRDQQANDRDHDEQLDEREAGVFSRADVQWLNPSDD